MSDAEDLRKRAWAADKAGHTGDALNLFRQIIREHPTSTAAVDARQYLASTSDPLGGSGAARVPDSVQVVRVVDLDISFMNLLGLFIKAAIAAIPALIIIAILYTVFYGMLAGLLVGLSQ